MSDFAPLYTTRERIQIVVKILAIATPVYLGSHYWLFPWLSAYAEEANCHIYGDITGIHLLMYGVFVFAPLSLVLLIWLLEGRRCMRVIRLGQNPLPGEKVLRKTRYKFGTAARIQPYVIFFLIAVLIGASIWGGFATQKLTRGIATCSSEQLGHQHN
jgi:hypothetical protein